MIVELHLKDDAEPLELHDGDEDNPQEAAQGPAIVALLEAFGGYIHGFDTTGHAVIVPAESIHYVRVLQP